MHFLKNASHFLNQWTPLHVAASKGRDYTVKYLVKKGADISIKDKAGVSITIPLMIDKFEAEYQTFTM